MVKLLIYSLLFISVSVTLNLTEVRKMYREIDKSKVNTEAFYNKLKNVKSTDKPVFVGYKASAEAAMAKYAKGVKNKKAGFKKAVKTLDAIIKKHPKNIELRLIRLSIQENSPKLLRYKQYITTDKAFIVNNIKSVKSKNLKAHIKGYVLQSKSFSTAEKNVFSEL